MPQTHLQPALFAPEEVPYQRLSVRLDIHLDGPAGRAETWVTISHTGGDQLACYGPDRAWLTGDWPAPALEVLQDALRTALKQLAPF